MPRCCSRSWSRRLLRAVVLLAAGLGAWAPAPAAEPDAPADEPAAPRPRLTAMPEDLKQPPYWGRTELSPEYAALTEAAWRGERVLFFRLWSDFLASGRRPDADLTELLLWAALNAEDACIFEAVLQQCEHPTATHAEAQPEQWYNDWPIVVAAAVRETGGMWFVERLLAHDAEPRGLNRALEAVYELRLRGSGFPEYEPDVAMQAFALRRFFGAEWETEDARDLAAREWAALRRDHPVVDYLAGAEPRPLPRDLSGAELRFMAEYASAPAEVLDLLFSQTDVERRLEPDGGTPLLCAARAGNWQVVAALIRAGADPEVRDQAGLGLRDFGKSLDYLPNAMPAPEYLWTRRFAADCVAQRRLAEAGAAGPWIPGTAEEAVTRYRRAAELGVPDAAYAMGVCAERGWGREASVAEALTWYRRAAECGLPEAQLRLALHYQELSRQAKQAGDGEGRQRAEWEYRRLLRAAARQSYPQAQYRMGRFYDKPDSPQSMRAALKWYLAASGCAESAYRVAECCELGLGVPANREDARWFYSKVLLQHAGHELAPKAAAALRRLGLEPQHVPTVSKELRALQYCELP